jgi:hypothetical protein
VQRCGVVALAVLAGVLLIAVTAGTDGLIPLRRVLVVDRRGPINAVSRLALSGTSPGT